MDVPGAFMQADMQDLVHVCFTGEMVIKLLEVDKEIDTIPTRNGRELGEIWVSKVGTNF